MEKTDLIARVAERTGLTRSQSANVVNAFLDTVTDALAQGEKVRLIGFGTFEVKHRAARRGRNPKTNLPMLIPEKKVPVFTMSGSTIRRILG